MLNILPRNRHFEPRSASGFWTTGHCQAFALNWSRMLWYGFAVLVGGHSAAALDEWELKKVHMSENPMYRNVSGRTDTSEVGLYANPKCGEVMNGRGRC